MGLNASGFRIVDIPDKVEEKTSSGIILPDSARDHQERSIMTGTVTSIGKDAWKSHGDGKPWAELGDTIVFDQYSGITFKEKSVNAEGVEEVTEYRILNDDEMLAKPE